MSFGSISTSSIGYSGSSLRFGLLDLKPVELRETIKRAGIKFQTIVRRFDSIKSPATYNDMILNQNEAIFASISVPKWFDSEKLTKEYTRFANENYEQDTEFKNAVENIKKSKGKIGKPLLSFVVLAKNKFNSEIDSYFEVESDRFIRSNLPLSFYNSLTSFDDTYQKFLMILENRVRHFEFRAQCARNFQMYEKIIAGMKKNIGPVIDQVDATFLQYFRLKHYLSIWNSKNYQEIIDPKYIDIKNFDYQEFTRIANDYYASLNQTRNILLSESSSLLVDNSPKEDITRNLFNDLLTLPTGSLNQGC